MSRFNLADLERMSVIVPDLAGLQNGDILMKKGSKGAADEVGIVVYVPPITAAMKADWCLLQKEVIVVTVRATYRQATLGTWGNRESTFGGFTTDPNGFVARRLLIDTGLAQDELKSAKIDPAWNLTSPVIDADQTTFRIASMYEHTRVFPEGEDRTSLRERWIPNTGEYLRLNAYVTIRNASGAAIEPTAFFPDGIRVKIGAKDRNYEANSQDNIKQNKGTGYSLSGGYNNGASFEYLGQLAPNGATYTPSGSGTFWLSSSGLVVAKQGANTGYACIRPLQANNDRWIRPGDDIILTATLTKGDGTVITTNALESAPSDYLAVYDKKMLWRANLYIDETQKEQKDASGTVTQAMVYDWNDLHPWNVPAGIISASSSGAILAEPIGGIPIWWDSNWGFNEWNRKFSLEQAFTGSATVGLTNLPVGDGKQVVTLPTFTPVRTLKDSVGSVTSKNVIEGTVAYSYPKHGYETVSPWGGTPPQPKIAGKGERQGAPLWEPDSTGNPGSMDSPFDFVWKMRRQKADIGSSAVQGQATGNSWWSYVVTKPEGEYGTDLDQDDVRFVPSLGLYLFVPGSVYNEQNTTAELNTSTDPDAWTVQTSADGAASATSTTVNLATTHKRRNASWIIEAGTDCVGFAQRAASFEGNKYEWVDLPDGLMEDGGEKNIYSVFARYSGIKYRNTVRSSGDSANAYNIVVKDKNVAATAANLDSLRRVVPGDVWLKYKVAAASQDSGTGTGPTHIAIVAYVPANAMELDAETLMSKIILIEGEYTNKIQSVIKKLSVGMYNGNSLPVGTMIYPGFTVEDQKPNTPAEDPIELNCQSWAIRRLK